MGLALFGTLRQQGLHIDHQHHPVQRSTAAVAGEPVEQVTLVLGIELRGRAPAPVPELFRPLVDSIIEALIKDVASGVAEAEKRLILIGVTASPVILARIAVEPNPVVAARLSRILEALSDGPSRAR